MSEFVTAAVFLLIGGISVSYLYSGVLLDGLGTFSQDHPSLSRHLGFERREPTRMDRRLRSVDLSTGMQDRRESVGRRIIDAAY